MDYEEMLFLLSRTRYRKYHKVCKNAIRFTDEGPDLCRTVDRDLWEDCVKHTLEAYRKQKNE